MPTAQTDAETEKPANDAVHPFDRPLEEMSEVERGIYFTALGAYAHHLASALRHTNPEAIHLLVEGNSDFCREHGIWCRAMQRLDTAARFFWADKVHQEIYLRHTPAVSETVQ